MTVKDSHSLAVIKSSVVIGVSHYDSHKIHTHIHTYINPDGIVYVCPPRLSAVITPQSQ